MAGGVIDGQPVNQAVTNPAFIIKNADDTTPSKLGLANTDPLSGGSITNTQLEINGIESFVGKITNTSATALPPWTHNEVGTSTDPLFERVDDITTLFNGATGHIHDGTDGQGPQLPNASISNSPTTPTAVGSTSVIGTSGAFAWDDHQHQGVSSLSASGNSPLYGDITLVGASGVSLDQTGNTITIYSPGATGGGSGSGGINYITSPDAEAGIGDWVAYAPASVITESLTTDSSVNVTAASTWWGQGFTPDFSSTVASVTLKLASTGTIAGTLTAAIYASSSGLPTGVALATSATVSAASLTGTATDTVFTFSTPVSVLSGIEYFIVLDSSSVTGLDVSNYYSISRNSSDVYSGGTAASSVTSGSAWSSSATDLYFIATSPVAPDVTVSVSSSSPLRGTASFVLSKPASACTGQGVKIPFTIDNCDQGKVLSIYSDFSLSGTYADGDLEVQIYDVTNAAYIPAQPATVLNTLVYGEINAEFQTPVTSVNYELRLNVASGSVAAFDFKFDNVQVGPDFIPQGTPITDWASFTASGSLTTNTTYTGLHHRVGDTDEIQVKLSFAGAPNAAAITVNLPPGEAIDTAKLTASGQYTAPLGTAQYLTAGTAPLFLQVVPGPSANTVQLIWQSSVANASQSAASQTSPVTIGAGDQLNIRFSVPIQGWSSSVQMSSDASTRVVALAINSLSGSQTTSGTAQNVTTWGASDVDTHSAFNAATGEFTVPVSGQYLITGSVSFNYTATAGNQQTFVYKNGVSAITGDWVYASTANPSQTSSSFNGILNCNAGDVINIKAYQASGGSLGYAAGNLAVTRLSGPSQIAASESVIVSYNSSSSQSFSSGADGVINTWTKIVDSHGSFDSSTSTFTAPMSASYAFSAAVTFNPDGTGTGTRYLRLFYNGSWIQGTSVPGHASSTVSAIMPTFIQPMLAGETLQMIVVQTSGGSLALDGLSNDNWISIRKVGNY